MLLITIWEQLLLEVIPAWGLLRFHLLHLSLPSDFELYSPAFPRRLIESQIQEKDVQMPKNYIISFTDFYITYPPKTQQLKVTKVLSSSQVWLSSQADLIDPEDPGGPFGLGQDQLHMSELTHSLGS